LNSQFLAVAEVRRLLWVVVVVAQIYLHFERGSIARAQKEAAGDTVDRIYTILLDAPIDPSALVAQLHLLLDAPDVIEYVLRNIVNIDWLAAHLADVYLSLEQHDLAPEAKESAGAALGQIRELLLAPRIEPQAVVDQLLLLKQSTPDSAILLLNKLADPSSPARSAAQAIIDRFNASA
jgi:hypothetical protein